MKLRNKRTGEIIDVYKGQILLHYNQGKKTIQFKSIEELEEWEDYEEPKEYWGIDYSSCHKGGIEEFTYDDDNIDEFNKSIGNYFETKEEAEQAVEKLKAWQRLKDKGADFYGWRRNQTGTYELYLRWEDRIPRSYEIKNDLNLLFGGEE